jgi:phosphonate transport system substrate-binding protein
VRFGVEPYATGPAFKAAYEEVASALSERLDCPVELVLADSYAIELEAMRAGKLDLAEFGPLGLVFAQRLAGAEPLVSFGDGGKLSTYTAAIWVPKDSPIESVEDLRGKTVAFGEPTSTSGGLLPTKALKDAGLEPGEDVEVRYTGGHDAAVVALKSGKVDAAEVNSQTESSYAADGKLDPADYRKLWVSEPVPNDPITVRGDLPQAFKDRVAEALRELPTATIAKVGKYLDVKDPTPMVPVTAEDYAEIAAMADTLGLGPKDAG